MEIISQKPDDKNKGGNPESHQEAVADWRNPMTKIKKMRNWTKSG
jgi:hypothetical protein